MKLCVLFGIGVRMGQDTDIYVSSFYYDFVGWKMPMISWRPMTDKTFVWNIPYKI